MYSGLLTNWTLLLKKWNFFYFIIRLESCSAKFQTGNGKLYLTEHLQYPAEVTHHDPRVAGGARVEGKKKYEHFNELGFFSKIIPLGFF